MANKTVTVKPADGDYTTLQGAITGEVAANANLVTMDGVLTISIEGDWNAAPDTTAVAISGFTTDATRYLKIVTDAANRARSSGIDATKYILQVTDADCLTLNDNHIWIDGLQISEVYSAVNNKACIIDSSIAAANLLKVSNCYLKTTGTSGRGISASDNSDIWKIWNCVIWATQTGIRIYYSTTVDIYNCTIYGGNAAGINADAGPTVTVKNCAVFNTADDFGGTITIDHCASDDGDGTNDVAESGGGAAWPSDFVAAASGDFTLKSTSNLVGTGVNDPGAGLYSDDIDGVARTSTWDVGADEYIAAAGGSIVPLVMMQMNQFAGGVKI